MGWPIGTLVERTTRLVILARREGTDAASAREDFTKKLRHVPAPLRKTLTYDRGKEMAEHECLAERFAIGYSLPIRTAGGNVAPTRPLRGCYVSTHPLHLELDTVREL